MSGWAILAEVLVALGAYFGIGAVYARSRYLDIYRKRLAANRKDFTTERYILQYAKSETALALAWRFTAWPYAMVYDGLRGPLAQWFTAPLAKNERERQEALDSARFWAGEMEKATTADERLFAREAFQLNMDKVKELEL